MLTPFDYLPGSAILLLSHKRGNFAVLGNFSLDGTFLQILSHRVFVHLLFVDLLLSALLVLVVLEFLRELLLLLKLFLRLLLRLLISSKASFLKFFSLLLKVFQRLLCGIIKVDLFICQLYHFTQVWISTPG